jgi:hypothetical protein
VSAIATRRKANACVLVVLSKYGVGIIVTSSTELTDHPMRL